MKVHCSLSEAQVENLYKVVYKEMLTALTEGRPFEKNEVDTFMKGLFEKIQAQRNDNVASTFLQIVPTLMNEAIDQVELENLKFDANFNRELILKFRNPENGLLETLKYFKPTATVKDLEVAMDIEKNILNNPVGTSDEEIDDIINDPFRWQALTAFSSTMQELEPRNPNEKDKLGKEVKDLNKIRIYRTIRQIRDEGKKETALSELVYQGRVLTLVPEMLGSLNAKSLLDKTTVDLLIKGNSIPEATTREKGITPIKTVIALVVSDEWGKPLFFDAQGNITSQEQGGQIVYQFLRDVRTEKNSDRLRVTDIYGIEDRILSPEDIIERQASKMQMGIDSYKKWLVKQGTTYEKVLASVDQQQQEQFQELKKLTDEVRAGDKKRLSISGVSAGIHDIFFYEDSVTLDKLIKEYKLPKNNLNIQIDAETSQAIIYAGEQYYAIDRANLKEEYIKQIAAVLVNPNISNKQKHDFYLQFTDNSINKNSRKNPRKIFVNLSAKNELTVMYRADILSKPVPIKLDHPKAEQHIIDSLLKESSYVTDKGETRTYATNMTFRESLLNGGTFVLYDTTTKKFTPTSYIDFLLSQNLKIVNPDKNITKSGNENNPYFTFSIDNTFTEEIKEAKEAVSVDADSIIRQRKDDLVKKLKANDKLSGTILTGKAFTDATFTMTIDGVIVEGRYEDGKPVAGIKSGDLVTFIVSDIIKRNSVPVTDVISIYKGDKKIGQVSETNFKEGEKQRVKTEAEIKQADSEYVAPIDVITPEDLSSIVDMLDLSRSSSLPNDVTPEQIEAATEWWANSPLSKLIKLEHMANIVNSDVYARFIIAGKRLEDTAIQLDTATGGSTVDLYHEAWHAFTQLYLTKEQKTKLYAETRKRLSNKDLSPVEVEEILAEEFRDYAKDPKTKSDAPVRNTIFRKIWNFIKKLFGQRTTKDELFEKLFFASKNPKLLNKYTPLVDNHMFNTLNRARGIVSKETKELVLNYQDSIKVANQLDSALSVFIDEVYNTRLAKKKNNQVDVAGNLVRANKSGTIQILASDKNRAIAYELIRKRFNEKLITFNNELNNTPDEDFNKRAVLNDKVRILTNALNNWDSVINFHKEHSTFDLIKQKYIEISEEEEELDNDNTAPESNSDGGTYSEKRTGEKSLLQLAEKETLYILKSLFKQVDGAQVTGPLGFPELADFSKTWNIVTKVIGGEKNPIKMYDKLVEGSAQYPELVQLINTKIPDPRTIDTLEEFNIKAAFWQDFKKTQVRYVQLTIDKDGETKAYKSEVTDASIEFKNIINKFKSSFNSSAETKYITKTADNKSQLKIDTVVAAFPSVSTPKEQIEFARAIGIELQDLKSIKDELGNNQKKYGIPYLFDITKAVQALSKNPNANKEQKEFIEKFLANPVEALYGKIPAGIYKQVESEKGVLQNLAKLQSKFGTEYASFSVLNAEKNLVNEFIEDSTASIIVDAINNVPNGRDLWTKNKYKYMRYLNPTINGFTEQSQILKNIFYVDENTWDRKRDGKLDFVMVSGTQMVGTNDGANTTSLDVHSKYIQELNMMLKSGFQEFMRHASKASSFGMKASKLKLYVELDQFAPNGDADQYAVDNIFLGYIQAELMRIQKIRANKEEYKKYAGYNREIKSADGKTVLGIAGEFFTAFDNVLTEDTKNEIIDKVKDGKLIDYLESDPQLKKDITEQITKYFKDQTYVNQKDFQKAKWIDPALHNKLKVHELSAEEEETLLIKAHTMNAWIHNFETASLIYGDIVQYNHAKQELHKRNTGSTSGGRGFMTDRYTQNFINGNLINGSSYGNKLAALPEFGEDYSTFSYNGEYNTAILQDISRNSVYLKHIEKALRDDYTKRGVAKDIIEYRIAKELKAYSGMEEGDGQGFITFDAYRTLRLVEKNWSADQEDLFQDIINNKPVKAEDIAHFFPVYKLQHFGHLANTSLPVNAMHKFALMPLIPSVIKGSDLESLHHQMMKGNIQYATFQTGSKVGSVTSNGKADKIYDDNGEQKSLKSDITFTPNTIYLEYLKNVTAVPDKYKGKTVFATQLRKLILEGLYEKGKVVNPENTQYIKEYEKVVDEYTDILKKELLEEIGYEKVDGKYVSGDLSKFMDVIQRELERKEIPEHLIDYIQVGKNNTITKDLSLHMLSGDIEKMITSIVEKRIVKQKVKGEALVQVASAMSNGLWDSGFKFDKANTKDIEKYLGSNNLPFYHPEDINLDDKYNGYTQDKLKEALKKYTDILADQAKYYTDTNKENLRVEINYLNDIIAGKTPKVKSVSGKTTAMKVAIALQGDFTNLLKLKDNDGEVISTRERLNEMIKNDEWLNKGNNRKAITMTAVRIPVQGLNSMEFMEVYEFLDPSAGNIIIPPSEIVAKSGADFDVDKLTTFMPNIDARGQYVESGMDAETLNRLIAASKKKGDKAELTRLIKLQKAAIENKLIDSIRGILELPDNYATLVRPNDTYLMKDIADKLVDALPEYSRYKTISPTNTLEVGYNLHKHEANMVGKDVLGIIALENALHPLYTSLGAALPKTYKGLVKNKITKKYEEDPTVDYEMRLLLNHNKMDDGRISLSGINSEDGQDKIADLISHLMNGSVDVEKDAWIFFIQANKELIPMMMGLLKAGVPKREAIFFVSQPLVKEYARQQRLYDSTYADLIGKPTGLDESPKYNALQATLRQTDISNAIYDANETRLTKALANTEPNTEIVVRLSGISERSKVFKTTIKKLKSDIKKDKINLYDIESINTKEAPLFKYIIANPSDKFYHPLSNANYKDVAIAGTKRFDKFTVEQLESLVSNNDKSSPLAVAAFLHYLEYEKQIKAMSDLKRQSNPDTTTSKTIQEIMQKRLGLDMLAESSKVETDLVGKLRNQSILGSFFDNTLTEDLVEPLFPLTDDKRVSEYLLNYLKEKDVPAKFGEGSDGVTNFITSFKSALVNYIYQNKLNQIVSSGESFPGVPESFTSLDHQKFVADFMSMLSENTHLKELYSVLEQITDVPVNIFDPKTKKFKSQIAVLTLNNKAVVKGELASAYHQNLIDLADETIMKVKDPVKNKEISDMFKMLPLISILQNGVGNTKYGLSYVLPDTTYFEIVEPASRNFIKNGMNTNTFDRIAAMMIANDPNVNNYIDERFVVKRTNDSSIGTASQLSEDEKFKLGSYFVQMQFSNGGDMKTTVTRWLDTLKKKNSPMSKELFNDMINQVLTNKLIKYDAEGVIEHVRELGNEWFDEQTNNNWYDKFWEYVNKGFYQQFIRDLEKNNTTPDEIKNINKEIRNVYIQKLKSNYPQLGNITLDADNSTLTIENESLLKQLEPTIDRLMVGNHGVYVEFTEPQNKGVFIKKRKQYNEYDRNGIKLYEQFDTVNYADYKPGKWYADINEYNLAKKAQQSTSVNSNDIYSQLKNKNVVISNIKTKDGKYDRDANIKEAKANNRVYTMETVSDINSFSNPWAHFIRTGTIKTNTTKEAVINYIDWLTTDKFKDVKPKRKAFILDVLKSGKLKGRQLQYYAELGEPSHATALDYLINKYDWNTQSSTSVKKDVEISDALQNIIYKTGLEKTDYKVELINGKQTLVVTNSIPKKIFKSSVKFYSDYAEGIGLFERYGKKITVPGFEDVELMMEQGTNRVYEISTGFAIPTTNTTQKDILFELEEIFNKNDVRKAIASKPKIDANAANTTVVSLNEAPVSEGEPDGQTGGVEVQEQVPDRTVKVHDFSIVVKPDGKMYYANGNDLTDQTTINKAKIKMEYEDGTLRMSNFNKSNYYVLSDNTILGTGTTNLGKESVNNAETKQIILDRATPYKKSCN